MKHYIRYERFISLCILFTWLWLRLIISRFVFNEHFLEKDTPEYKIQQRLDRIDSWLLEVSKYVSACMK